MTKTSILPDCLQEPELLSGAITAALEHRIISPPQAEILATTMESISTLAKNATLGDRSTEGILFKVDSAFRRLQFGNNSDATPEQTYAAAELLKDIAITIGKITGINRARIADLFPASNPLKQWSHLPPAQSTSHAFASV
jgi:hypothetical protein